MLDIINYKEMKKMDYFEHIEMVGVFMQDCRVYKDLTDEEIKVLEAIVDKCDEHGYWLRFDLEQLAKKVKMPRKKVLRIINKTILNRTINNMEILRLLEVDYGGSKFLVFYSELAVYQQEENSLDDLEKEFYECWSSKINNSNYIDFLECE